MRFTWAATCWQRAPTEICVWNSANRKIYFSMRKVILHTRARNNNCRETGNNVKHSKMVTYTPWNDIALLNVNDRNGEKRYIYINQIVCRFFFDVFTLDSCITHGRRRHGDVQFEMLKCWPWPCLFLQFVEPLTFASHEYKTKKSNVYNSSCVIYIRNIRPPSTYISFWR